MKSTDLADATARALDLLAPGDPAATDPRLLRDARLIEEARLTRETAADVWLAVSPLHVAPPDVLQAVLAEIDPARPARAAIDHRRLKGLAITGWAAAAAVLVCLWPDSGEKTPPPEVSLALKNPSVAPVDAPSDAPSDAPAGIRSSRDGRLRTEILRLQNRLADVRDDRKTASPRVIALHTPGTAVRSAEDARRRVQAILTNALRAALEAESGASSDPASLVIERGWLAGGLPAREDGGLVRHRNFPEHSWRELGLLRSGDGTYYDAASDLVWTPDPKGYGFIGRQTTPADDLTAYQAEDDGPSATPTRQPRTEPQGFIVENPADQTAEVIIDQLPPPAGGGVHVILLTDSSGNTETIPIPPPAPPAGQEESLIARNFDPGDDPGTISTSLLQNLSSNFSVGSNSAGTLIFTIPSTNGLGSFQLVERPLVPNGQPDKIIVEGSP